MKNYEGTTLSEQNISDNCFPIELGLTNIYICLKSYLRCIHHVDSGQTVYCVNPDRQIIADSKSKERSIERDETQE